jgi:hypothetical protein
MNTRQVKVECIVVSVSSLPINVSVFFGAVHHHGNKNKLASMVSMVELEAIVHQ